MYKLIQICAIVAFSFSNIADGTMFTFIDETVETGNGDSRF